LRAFFGVLEVTPGVSRAANAVGAGPAHRRGARRRARHKGPRIFGLGTHLDAVRSTRKTKVFAFGHVGVVLAVAVPVP
jgi:hypothetical protein